MTRNLIGDMRLCDPERDAGKHPRDITDFEIWDGTEWVHAQEAAKRTYVVGPADPNAKVIIRFSDSE